MSGTEKDDFKDYYGTLTTGTSSAGQDHTLKRSQVRT